MDGLLLIDKSPGCTSHDVVKLARRTLRERKVGHCGTLDPDATGLLLLTFGRGTRLTRFLTQAPKVYEGVVRFGITTDTYDASGTVVEECEVPELDADAVQTAMRSFEGSYLQMPPAYSAKKINGRKYYELARRGEEVPRKSAEVQVYEFSPLGPPETPDLRFRLECGSGTYARSIAFDLGRKLGCGAHLASLRRTAIGPFAVANAVADESLDEAMDLETLGDAWIPFDQIPLPFQELTVDTLQERRIHHGQTVVTGDLRGEEGDWIRISNRQGEMVAIAVLTECLGESGPAVVQPKIVFSKG